MRMWAAVCVFVLTCAAVSGCKKKSACVRQCERYAKCDESTPNCDAFCKQAPPEAAAKMASCDEVAKGDCDAFLMCTGVKRKPSELPPTSETGAGVEHDAGTDDGGGVSNAQ